MVKKATTIYISDETRQELAKLKVHPRQSYEEVIRKLLEEYKKLKGGDIK
jgi:predicted CopG family antitoxin